MDDATDILATVPKNAREDVRLALSEFHGTPLVDLRTWAAFDGGERRPTKKGVSLNVARLPELIEGLQTVAAEAQRRGLLAPRE